MTKTQTKNDTKPLKHYQEYDHCISLKDVLLASSRIKGIAHKTPVLTSTSLDQLCSDDGDEDGEEGRTTRLFFKVEALQRTGSFKFRGALNATLQLTENTKTNNNNKDDDDEKDVVHVVTHSSGNHAAALALAAKLASSPLKNIRATIVMPKNAPPVKVNGVRGFGGNVVTVESTNEAREEEADRIVREERGARFVHPSEDVSVIAGQGTVGLEFVSQVREELGGGGGDLDAVVIPVGGGGLAAGNTVALRGILGQNVKIILAEPELMDDAKRSKLAGKLLGHERGNPLASVADGLKTTLGPNTWPIVRDLVDDIMTVGEDDILKATKLIWERLKVCIEPSAGVGVAVAMGEEFRRKYLSEDGIVNVGVILCGGNVDIVKIAKLMEEKGI